MTRLLIAVSLLTAGLAAGCAPTQPKQVAGPDEFLPPQKISIHPFTGTRAFSKEEGVGALDVRMEAMDRLGRPTQAMGTFRFELFDYRPHESDPRGNRLAVWSQDIRDPARNAERWDDISHTYQFRLVWTRPFPAGRKYVLDAIYSSPDGPRLFDRRVFVSGE